MQLTRRGFLASLAAGALVVAAPKLMVPERRLWRLDRTMTAPKAGDPIAALQAEMATYAMAMVDAYRCPVFEPVQVYDWRLETQEPNPPWLHPSQQRILDAYERQLASYGALVGTRSTRFVRFPRPSGKTYDYVRHEWDALGLGD